MKNLSSFFSPESIAIVGASPKKGKLGNVLIENIKKGGWPASTRARRGGKGKLYFVNPKYAKAKREYFSSLEEIKRPIDLVLIAIPAQFVSGSLENGATATPKIKNFAIISSGFKEAGIEGKKFEENLKNIAKKFSLNVLGPNCLGFANQYEKLNATFTDMQMQKGDIAIVSQSGALAVALLDWAAGKNIGFSKIISVGNKTVLDESAILDFLSRDKNTKAVALYLEDIKNGQKFMEVAAKITPKKPLVVLKAGKTAAGQKAVSSHTGSLAQDQDIIDAVFEKLNVIPADNFEEFQSVIYYLNSNPIPSKKEVIVLTNAGGPGVMASDFIGKSKDIKLLNFPEDFKEKLKENLPASASAENPIDVIGDAPPERYRRSLELIAKYFPKNPVLAVLTPQNQTDPARVAQILGKYKKMIPNLSACFMGGEKIAKAKKVLEKYSIPNFHRPEKALAVIERLAKYFESVVITRSAATKQSQTTQRKTGLLRYARNDPKNALAENRKMLFWDESERLFAKYGIRLAHSISLKDLSELKNKNIKFPCALKTDDPNIAHRLEKNAVILNVQNAEELRNAFGKMQKSTRAKRFLVQPMADPGLELIIGMKCDPSFGPVILCGWGGSLTEIFKDKTILIPPLTRREVANRLSQLAIFPILKGFRGKKGYNLAEISKIIAAVAQTSLENPEIGEIDINPLVLYNDGGSGQILDAKVFLKQTHD